MSVDISKWSEADFHDFVVENAPVFHLFARRYIDDPSVADDMLQDSFVKLWTHRAAVGVLESPVNYFFSVVRNTIINSRRSQKNRHVRLNAESSAELADESFFLRSVIEAESAGIIAESIGKLPEQARKVIMMTLRQKKMQEIADELGVSINTVKTVKYRALERLSKLLSREDFLLLLSGCCITYF